jgi:chromosomal replication initiator protein
MSDISDYKMIWNETITQIKEELEEQEFLTWFNLEFQEATEKEITISVPSMFYLDQVKKRYHADIEGKIEGLIGKRVI